VDRGRIAAVVTVLAVLGVLLVLFVAGVAATRGDVELAEAPPDAADLDLPAGRLGADDVRRVRFGVTLRGYRMSEVDALLERLAAQLDEQQERQEAAARRSAPVAAPPATHDDEA
jgi:DivIVA domain-containing protein